MSTAGSSQQAQQRRKLPLSQLGITNFLTGPAIKRKAVATRSASLQTPLSSLTHQTTSPTSPRAPYASSSPRAATIQSPQSATWSPFDDIDVDQVATSVYSASATPLPQKPTVQRAVTAPQTGQLSEPTVRSMNTGHGTATRRTERPRSNYDLTASLGWGRKATRIVDTTFMLPPPPPPQSTAAQVESQGCFLMVDDK
jgi:hypothetical protein